MINLILFVVFWAYIYNIRLFNMPFSSVKMLFLLAISILFFSKFFFQNKLSKDIIKSAIVGLLPLGFAFISSFINSNTELLFYSLMLNLPIQMVAFYLFYYIAKKTRKTIDFRYIANFFIIASVVQCFIALISFIFPNICVFLLSIQDIGREEGAINRTFGLRLIGFGSMFFGAGIANSVCLCLIASLIGNENTPKYCFKYYFIAYFIVLLVGMMMSRSTVIGFLVSILYLFNKKSICMIKRNLKTIITVAVLFIAVSTVFYLNMQKQLDILVKFAFEAIMKFSEGNGFETTSTNKMMKMYTFPDSNEYKTWLLGDAKFMDDIIGYYKHTDIGYCRGIYYFGVIGLLSFILSQIYLVYLSSKKNNSYKLFFFSLSIMFVVFNLKGFAPIDLYAIPFLFCDEEKLGLG